MKDTEKFTRSDAGIGPRDIVVAVHEPTGMTTVVLGQSVARIGSAEHCEIRLSGAFVSREHAEVQLETNGVSVRDLASTNGTIYQGSRISHGLVPFGSQITIGDTRLVFQPPGVAALPPSDRTRFGSLVGVSALMRELFSVLQATARSDSTILVLGESGTGKELIARAIHDESPRRDGPFVVIDSAALHEGTADSALFGHTRGAFTGAAYDRPGAFLRAQGGTLFIDEVGELSSAVQAKLLRAIESRTVQPLGSDDRSDVDVRLVAATLQPLEEMVERGEFRFDLYQRLSVISVRAPPLRERPEDLVVLVEHFLRAMSIEPGEITGPNLDKLMRYAWPGNVRELRNVIERSVVLTPIPPTSFSALNLVIGTSTSEPLVQVNLEIDYHTAKSTLLEAFERQYVASVMERFGGNLSRAALHAKLNRKHLRDLLKKHGLYNSSL
ncbi:MAG: sigma 54-interacting transcriptional regulator [Myxococcota bacterium]